MSGPRAGQPSRSLTLDEREVEQGFGSRSKAPRQLLFALAPPPPAEGRGLAAASFSMGVDCPTAYVGGSSALSCEDLLALEGARQVIVTPGHQISPQMGDLGRLCSMSAKEVGEVLLSWQTSDKTPRAKEDASGVPAHLLQRHPRLFPSRFLAGSMQRARDTWLKAFGPDDPYVRQVSDGVSFEWDSRLRLTAEQLNERIWLDNFVKDDEAIKVISEKLLQHLAEGALLDVTEFQEFQDVVAHCLPVFAIKQGKKWRVVWDARELNAKVYNEPFKMEGIATAARMLRPGDYMVSIDMWSSYFQLLLRPDVRKYCCLRWGGRVFQWQAMPFGLSVAPRIYQKVILKLFGIWRKRGYRCATYEEACRIRDDVLKDLEEFGFVINREKAQLNPCQAVRFLGVIFDTSGPTVRLFVPDDKLEKVVDLARDLQVAAGEDRPVAALKVASLVGKLVSMHAALPAARLITRELLACLRQLPLVTTRVADGKWQQVRDYSQSVRLSPAARLELRLAARLPGLNGGHWFSSSPTRLLSTDGSGWGVGGLVRDLNDGAEGRVLAWLRGEHEMALEERGSVRTELEALLRSLVQLGPELRGQTVLHHTDSLATWYGLKNGGYAVGENSELNLTAKKVWLACLMLDVRLVSEYVGSAGIIRSGADALSRTWEDRTCLHPGAAAWAMEQLRVWPTVDLFAEAGYVQVGQGGRRMAFYVCPGGDTTAEGCLGADSLSKPWQGVGYAFPPLDLIHPAVEKAQAEARERGAATLLVAPDWPQRPWYALLHGCPSRELGSLEKCTALPPGAKGPIESQATRRRTSLRAWLIAPR